VPRDREHPRRLGRHRPVVVHHDEPAVTEPSPSVSRETPPVEEQARLALLAVADEAAPPLSRERIARLEAATALWVREVRLGGPGPDDTLLYASPKPPPPTRTQAEEPAPVPVPAVEPEPQVNREEPRVVRDWSSRHDPQSRDFDVSDALAGRVPLADKMWPIGPIFDQGTTPPLSLHDASGCVGMGVAAAANTLEMAATASAASLRGLLQKEDALQLYARAQQLDSVSGDSYAGTSVLAGMKAGQEAGLWSEYLWAFGTRPLAQAIMQVGPAVIGIPWTTGMEDPDPGGVIRPGGSAAGGHCMALVGLVTSRPGGPWFVAQQSRGPTVGDHGLVLIHHKDLSRLLAGVGEAAVPVPPGARK
jgi:hypothetical protein